MTCMDGKIYIQECESSSTCKFQDHIINGKKLPRRFLILSDVVISANWNARGINFVIRILYSTVYLYLLDIFFTFCSKKYLLNFQIHGCLFNLQIIEHLSGNKTVQRDDKKNYRFFFTKTQVDLFFYS